MVCATDGSDNGSVDCGCSFAKNGSVSSYSEQLSKLKAKAPNSMRNRATLNSHYLVIEMHIHEWPLSLRDPTDTSPTAIIKSLQSCLSAAKSFFNVLFSLPPVYLFELTFVVQLHVAHALSTLFRLSIFAYPGWDLTEMRSSIGLAAVIAELQTMLEGTRNVLPNSDLEKHVFTRTVAPLQAFKGLLDQQRPGVDGADVEANKLIDLPALSDIDLDSLLAGLKVPMWMDFSS